MQNNIDESDKLIPITVRFTAGAMSVIDDLAIAQDKSKAEVIRTSVDKELLQYLDKVCFVDKEQGQQIHADIYALTCAIQSMQIELNRIGINYNQDLKIKQIEKRYANAFDFDQIMSKTNAINVVKNDTTNLNKDDLDNILTRFEVATKKVGDALCLIVG